MISSQPLQTFQPSFSIVLGKYHSDDAAFFPNDKRPMLRVGGQNICRKCEAYINLFSVFERLHVKRHFTTPYWTERPFLCRIFAVIIFAVNEHSKHKIHILHKLQTFHENYMKLKFQMRNLNVQHYGWNEENFYRFHNTNIFIEM